MVMLADEHEGQVELGLFACLVGVVGCCRLDVRMDRRSQCTRRIFADVGMSAFGWLAYAAEREDHVQNSGF